MRVLYKTPHGWHIIDQNGVQKFTLDQKLVEKITAQSIEKVTE